MTTASLRSRIMTNRTVTILAAGTLLVGVLIGRASANDGGKQTTKPSVPVSGNLDPKSYPHTKEGAASAAQRYYDALFRAAMSSPEQRRAVVDEVANAAMRQEITKTVDQTAEALAKLFDLPKDQAQVVTRFAPLGYRVLSYTGQSARIDLWALALFGKPDVGHGIAPQYKTATFDLSWERSAWRLAGSGEIKDGPTPIPDNPQAGADLATAVKDMQEFDHVAR
jgi:hypothetical protein